MEKFNCDCGFSWLKGFSGQHNCSPYYRETIEALKTNVERYQKLVCQTCDGHGAVGNILDSMDCPDCTAAANNDQHFAKYEQSQFHVTKDGHTMTTFDIAKELNRKSHLERQAIARGETIVSQQEEINELKAMVTQLTAEAGLFCSAFYISQSKWIEQVTGAARSQTDKEVMDGAKSVVANVRADAVRDFKQSILESIKGDDEAYVKSIHELLNANKLREQAKGVNQK